MHNAELVSPVKGNNQPVAVNQPMTFSVDELLAKIDQVKNQGYGPEPAFIERLVSPSARELGRAIDEAKTSSIRVRTELIQGLGSCLAVFVDCHKADLKVRGSSFVAATFSKLIGNLNAISESTITSFFDTYSQAVDQYRLIPNLSESMREALSKKAWDRALRIAEVNENAFYDIVCNLRDQVIKLSNEIGDRPKA